MKRLATLEKERRENDKAAEAKKEQTSTPVQPAQPAYRAAAPVRTAAPPKSRKGLYIVLGAVLGVVLLIIIASISTTRIVIQLTPPGRCAGADQPS